MQRRDFLQWMSVGAAGSVPLFVFGCGKDEAPEPGAAADEPKLDLHAALLHAKQLGKPLLVLAIPDDRDARWEREQDFGRWLNYADDAMLADLALVEVVCASTIELRDAGVAGTKPEAWMHLVDTSATEFVAHPIMIAPAESPTPRYSRTAEGVLEVSDPMEDRLRAELHAVHDPFHAALDPNVRLAALASQPEATLAESAKRRLREKAPNGAKWARATGCGISIEGEKREAPIPLCGMGMVEPHSKRLLRFFTREPN